jgi:CTP:molybdopterin cytidylyltransferase MocA
MTIALVPAAGQSTRMGRPKLTLPLAKRTVIEHVVQALRDGGCQSVFVVAGPHAPEIAALATSAGARTVTLSQPTRDMRATVDEGLRFIEKTCQPMPRDPWILAPADHPTLKADIVRQLLDGFHRATHSIVIPVISGKRGHPTVLAWSHVEGIRAHPSDKGLNTYLQTRQSEILELPVDDPSVLWDLDTPADYERLQTLFSD